jgi:hypothetical protein
LTAGAAQKKTGLPWIEVNPQASRFLVPTGESETKGFDRVIVGSLTIETTENHS